MGVEAVAKVGRKTANIVPNRTTSQRFCICGLLRIALERDGAEKGRHITASKRL
jgi:hypothetical protein